MANPDQPRSAEINNYCRRPATIGAQLQGSNFELLSVGLPRLQSSSSPLMMPRDLAARQQPVPSPTQHEMAQLLLQLREERMQVTRQLERTRDELEQLSRSGSSRAGDVAREELRELLMARTSEERSRHEIASHYGAEQHELRHMRRLSCSETGNKTSNYDEPGDDLQHQSLSSSDTLQSP